MSGLDETGGCACVACSCRSHKRTLQLLGIQRMLRNSHRRVPEYKCAVCEEMFGSFGRLSQHIRKEHEDGV